MKCSWMIFLLSLMVLGLCSLSLVSAEDIAVDCDDCIQLARVDFNDSDLLSAGGSGSFSDIQSKVNAAKEGSTLLLNNNFSSGSGQIVVSKNLVIDGQGNVLDAMSKKDSSILDIRANVNLVNIVFKNYNAGAVTVSGDGCLNVVNCSFVGGSSSGAAILNDVKKSVVVRNSSFYNNVVKGSGGAISSVGDVIISDSIFEGNGALDSRAIQVFLIGSLTTFKNSYGGAVYSKSGVSVSNSRFSDNSAYEDGGAVYGGVYVHVSNSTFDSNSAQGTGGAIYAGEGVFGLNNRFTRNSAVKKGGAVYVNYVKSEIGNATFERNYVSDGDGGALYINKASDFSIVASRFVNNHANAGDGGAVYSDSGSTTITLSNSVFCDNYANGGKLRRMGGAVYSAGSLRVVNSTFLNNWAENQGGAIYCKDTVSFSGNASYFVGNIARKSSGGAIFTSMLNKDVCNVVFEGNEANGGDGGALYINNACTVNFSNCYFSSNTCSGRGGAIYTDSRKFKLVLKNNVFYGNKASEGSAVFNSGYFDSVRGNFWGGSNPSKSNGMLVEWKQWPFSNVVHVDSSPANIRFSAVDSGYVDVPLVMKLSYSWDLNNCPVYMDKVVLSSSLNGEFNKTVVGSDVLISYVPHEVGNHIVAVSDASGRKFSHTVNVVNHIGVFADDLVKVYGDSTDFSAKFTDDKGNVLVDGIVVSFELDGVAYNSTVGDGGVAKLNVSLNPGNYSVKSVNTVTGDFSLNSITVLPRVSEYFVNDTYGVSFVDFDGEALSDGNVVSFVVGNQSFSRDVVGGVASFRLDFVPGVYPVNVVYNGSVVFTDTVRLSDRVSYFGDGFTFGSSRPIVGESFVNIGDYLYRSDLGDNYYRIINMMEGSNYIVYNVTVNDADALIKLFKSISSKEIMADVYEISLSNKEYVVSDYGWKDSDYKYLLYVSYGRVNIYGNGAVIKSNGDYTFAYVASNSNLYLSNLTLTKFKQCFKNFGSVYANSSVFKNNDGDTSWYSHDVYFGSVINNFEKAFFVDCVFDGNTNSNVLEDEAFYHRLGIIHNTAGVLYAQKNSMTAFVNCSFKTKTDNIHALPASNIVFYNDDASYARGVYEEDSCVSVKSLDLWYNNSESYNVGVFNCSTTEELCNVLSLVNRHNNYSSIIINLEKGSYNINKANLTLQSKDDYHDWTHYVAGIKEYYWFEVGSVPVTINGNAATIKLTDADKSDRFHFAFVSKYGSLTVNNVIFSGFNTVIHNIGLTYLNNVRFNSNVFKFKIFGGDWGGALYNDGKMYCVNCSFTNNVASWGSAIYCANSSGTFLQIVGGQFTNNDGEDIRLTGTSFLKLVDVNPVVTKKDDSQVYKASSSESLSIDVNVTSFSDLMAVRNLVNSNVGAYDLIRIHFSPGSYVYLHSAGSLFDVKYGSVLIDGAGASVSVHSPDKSDEIKFLTVGKGARVVLMNLTVSGFNIAVLNEGYLELHDCTFSGNKVDYKFSKDYSGAIFNKGYLMVYSSVFSDNFGKYAGAIYSTGYCLCFNSTFTDNVDYYSGSSVDVYNFDGTFNNIGGSGTKVSNVFHMETWKRDLLQAGTLLAVAAVSFGVGYAVGAALAPRIAVVAAKVVAVAAGTFAGTAVGTVSALVEGYYDQDYSRVWSASLQSAVIAFGFSSLGASKAISNYHAQHGAGGNDAVDDGDGSNDAVDGSDDGGDGGNRESLLIREPGPKIDSMPNDMQETANMFKQLSGDLEQDIRTFGNPKDTRIINTLNAYSNLLDSTRTVSTIEWQNMYLRLQNTLNDIYEANRAIYPSVGNVNPVAVNVNPQAVNVYSNVVVIGRNANDVVDYVHYQNGVTVYNVVNSILHNANFVYEVRGMSEVIHSDEYYNLRGQLEVIRLFYPSVYPVVSGVVGDDIEGFINDNEGNYSDVILRAVANHLRVYGAVNAAESDRTLNNMLYGYFYQVFHDVSSGHEGHELLEDQFDRILGSFSFIRDGIRSNVLHNSYYGFVRDNGNDSVNVILGHVRNLLHVDNVNITFFNPDNPVVVPDNPVVPDANQQNIVIYNNVYSILNNQSFGFGSDDARIGHQVNLIRLLYPSVHGAVRDRLINIDINRFREYGNLRGYILSYVREYLHLDNDVVPDINAGNRNVGHMVYDRVVNMSSGVVISGVNESEASALLGRMLSEINGTFPFVGDMLYRDVLRVDGNGLDAALRIFVRVNGNNSVNVILGHVRDLLHIDEVNQSVPNVVDNRSAIIQRYISLSEEVQSFSSRMNNSFQALGLETPAVLRDLDSFLLNSLGSSRRDFNIARINAGRMTMATYDFMESRLRYAQKLFEEEYSKVRPKVKVVVNDVRKKNVVVKNYKFDKANASIGLNIDFDKESKKAYSRAVEIVKDIRKDNPVLAQRLDSAVSSAYAAYLRDYNNLHSDIIIVTFDREAEVHGAFIDELNRIFGGLSNQYVNPVDVNADLMNELLCSNMYLDLNTSLFDFVFNLPDKFSSFKEDDQVSIIAGDLHFIRSNNFTLYQRIIDEVFSRYNITIEDYVLDEMELRKHFDDLGNIYLDIFNILGEGRDNDKIRSNQENVVMEILKFDVNYWHWANRFFNMLSKDNQNSIFHYMLNKSGVLLSKFNSSGFKSEDYMRFVIKYNELNMADSHNVTSEMFETLLRMYKQIFTQKAHDVNVSAIDVASLNNEQLGSLILKDLSIILFRSADDTRVRTILPSLWYTGTDSFKSIFHPSSYIKHLVRLNTEESRLKLIRIFNEIKESIGFWDIFCYLEFASVDIDTAAVVLDKKLDYDYLTKHPEYYNLIDGTLYDKVNLILKRFYLFEDNYPLEDILSEPYSGFNIVENINFLVNVLNYYYDNHDAKDIRENYVSFIKSEHDKFKSKIDSNSTLQKYFNVHKVVTVATRQSLISDLDMLEKDYPDLIKYIKGQFDDIEASLKQPSLYPILEYIDRCIRLYLNIDSYTIVDFNNNFYKFDIKKYVVVDEQDADHNQIIDNEIIDDTIIVDPIVEPIEVVDDTKIVRTCEYKGSEIKFTFTKDIPEDAINKLMNLDAIYSSTQSLYDNNITPDRIISIDVSLSRNIFAVIINVKDSNSILHYMSADVDEQDAGHDQIIDNQVNNDSIIDNEIIDNQENNDSIIDNEIIDNPIIEPIKEVDKKIIRTCTYNGKVVIFTFTKDIPEDSIKKMMNLDKIFSASKVFDERNITPDRILSIDVSVHSRNVLVGVMDVRPDKPIFIYHRDSLVGNPIVEPIKEVDTEIVRTCVYNGSEIKFTFTKDIPEDSIKNAMDLDELFSASKVFDERNITPDRIISIDVSVHHRNVLALLMNVKDGEPIYMHRYDPLVGNSKIGEDDEFYVDEPIEVVDSKIVRTCVYNGSEIKFTFTKGIPKDAMDEVMDLDNKSNSLSEALHDNNITPDRIISINVYVHSRNVLGVLINVKDDKPFFTYMSAGVNGPKVDYDSIFPNPVVVVPTDVFDSKIERTRVYNGSEIKFTFTKDMPKDAMDALMDLNKINSLSEALHDNNITFNKINSLSEALHDNNITLDQIISIDAYVHSRNILGVLINAKDDKHILIFYNYIKYDK